MYAPQQDINRKTIGDEPTQLGSALALAGACTREIRAEVPTVILTQLSRRWQNMLRRVNINCPGRLWVALPFAAGFINSKPWSEVPSIADSFLPHCRALQHRARHRNRSRGTLRHRPSVTTLSNLQSRPGCPWTIRPASARAKRKIEPAPHTARRGLDAPAPTSAPAGAMPRRECRRNDANRY